MRMSLSGMISNDLMTTRRTGKTGKERTVWVSWRWRGLVDVKRL